jgi:plasmid maintenance system antidote protein VapI
MALTRTVPLEMLLRELGRLKDASKVVDTTAAKHLGCSAARINRILTGQNLVKPGDARLLGELYGASHELAAVLEDLARNLGQKGTWTSYQEVYNESGRFFNDLQRHSSRICVFQSEIVPGLLQVDDYIRAIGSIPTPFVESIDVETAVRARLEHQSILTTKENPPRVSVVLAESCLNRVYGGTTVMRAQLERIIEVAALPNVQLQVLPEDSVDSPSHAWLSFQMLHVPSPGILPPLNFVYVAQLDDGRYIDRPDLVEKYEITWGHLQAAALGPKDSVEFVKGKVADRYS